MNILSLGAGVQSSAMALMAARGELTPMPDAAIFADTGAEPNSVYKWLGWLEAQLPFPVYRVAKTTKHGERLSLETAALRVRTSKEGRNYTKHAVPAFIYDGSKQGILMRQCTSDFKIEVIQKKIRELSKGRPVTQWIGISWDEAIRCKPSRLAYITNIWPLVDLKLTRAHCLRWMADNGFPPPPRSSCVFCPYHSNAEWNRLKTQEPEEFARAVKWERDFQASLAQVRTIRGVPFLHRENKPLDSIDFTESASQPEFFGNECEGICGV